MADQQPTVDDQPTDLSPELRTALDVLLCLATAGAAPAYERPPVRTTPTTERVQPTTGPACRLPIGGGNNRCPLPAGHNGQCDPAPDPDFLGDPPEREADGTCSFCGDEWDKHWDSDAQEWMDGREWHRRDREGNGFYADEIPAVQR